jgi:hypothetical protein
LGSAGDRAGDGGIVAQVGEHEVDLPDRAHGLQEQTRFGIARGNANRAARGRKTLHKVPADEAGTAENGDQSVGHVFPRAAS